MTKRVMVIAAHPDDEVLGCAGTLALHIEQGHEVVCVIACQGHEAAMTQAHKILGITETHRLGFPDQRLDECVLQDLIKPIEVVVAEFHPQIIYGQFGGDVNRDHHMLFEAIKVVSRPPDRHLEAVYAFDTASSTEWGFPRSFVPDTWVDIGSTLAQKLDAMACYVDELRDYPHPRSLEALKYRAHAWGNQACLDAAEVFMTIRRRFSHGQTPI